MSQDNYRLFFSDRGIPLVLCKTPRLPTVTVENYLKWYELYVVFPDGRAEGISLPPFLDDPAWRSGYNDHCFHPALVQHVADTLGYEVDDNSLDMIRGRWVGETLGTPYDTMPTTGG